MGLNARAHAPHVAYVVEPPYSTFVLNEMEGLRRLGTKVTVLNSFRPFTQPQPAGELIRAESHYFSPGYRRLPGAVFSAMRRPSSLVRATMAVLRYGLTPRVILLASEYAALVRRTGVTHVHGMYGTTPATVALLTGWLAGVPYSFTCHAYEIYLPNPLLEWKARGAAFVTTISHFNKRYMLERWPLNPERLRVVHLGVDPEYWARPDPPPPLAGRRAEIICVASFIPCKGQLWLLRAAAKIRSSCDVRVTLVGEGPTRPELEQEIDRLALRETIVMAGAQTQDEVRRLVRAADLFVLPCIVDDNGYHDGLPVALMEAMAAGTPVISTTVSGIPELIEHGRSGLLVAPRDDDALAAAMDEVLRDPARWRELAAGGRVRVAGEFSLEHNARSMRALFAGETDIH